MGIIRILIFFSCFGTFAQEKFTTENIIIKHEGLRFKAKESSRVSTVG